MGYKQTYLTYGSTKTYNPKNMTTRAPKAPQRVTVRQAAKRPAGRTMTKTQKPRGSKNEGGNAGRFSFFSYTRKVHPGLARSNYKIMKTSATSAKTMINAATTFSSSVGQQNCQILGKICDVNDINEILSNNGAYSTLDPTQELLVHTTRATYDIANPRGTTCRLALYDCVYRHDSKTTAVNDVADAWNVGLNNEGGPTNAYRTPYQTPFTSRRFCEQYKVLKVTNVILSSGQVHCHKVFAKHNILINKERLTDVGINGVLANTTIVTFAVILGEVSNDSTDKTQVTYSYATINSIVSKQYQTYGSIHNVTRYDQSNNLPVAFTTDGKVMDEKVTAIISDLLRA